MPALGVEQAVETARIEVERDRLKDDNERLRRDLEEAHKTMETEREDAKQERAEMRGIITSTQKLLEDQSREREALRKGFLRWMFGR